jgi:hypothetical protein
MIWNVYCGSKIRIFPSRIPDPGVKKAPAPGSGSATLIGRILEYVVTNAVFADSGCLSRIPNPDIYPSRILDPGSNSSSKRGRGKKRKISSNFVL